MFSNEIINPLPSSLYNSANASNNNNNNGQQAKTVKINYKQRRIKKTDSFQENRQSVVEISLNETNATHQDQLKANNFTFAFKAADARDHCNNRLL